MWRGRLWSSENQLLATRDKPGAHGCKKVERNRVDMKQPLDIQDEVSGGFDILVHTAADLLRLREQQVALQLENLDLGAERIQPAIVHGRTHPLRADIG